MNECSGPTSTALNSADPASPCAEIPSRPQQPVVSVGSHRARIGVLLALGFFVSFLAACAGPERASRSPAATSAVSSEKAPATWKTPVTCSSAKECEDRCVQRDEVACEKIEAFLDHL